MKTKIKKYCLIGTAIIAGILLLTNPTPTDFKNYMGLNCQYCVHRRTANYLFFSTYEFHMENHSRKYRGILKNFYDIN
ncbi:MAG: hypothetical protein ACHQNT_05645 [Bacteroidia bacterium]